MQLTLLEIIEIIEYEKRRTKEFKEELKLEESLSEEERKQWKFLCNTRLETYNKLIDIFTFNGRLP